MCGDQIQTKTRTWIISTPITATDVLYRQYYVDIKITAVSTSGPTVIIFEVTVQRRSVGLVVVVTFTLSGTGGKQIVTATKHVNCLWERRIQVPEDIL